MNPKLHNVPRSNFASGGTSGQLVNKDTNGWKCESIISNVPVVCRQKEVIGSLSSHAFPRVLRPEGGHSSPEDENIRCLQEDVLLESTHPSSPKGPSLRGPRGRYCGNMLIKLIQEELLSPFFMRKLYRC